MMPDTDHHGVEEVHLRLARIAPLCRDIRATHGSPADKPLATCREIGGTFQGEDLRVETTSKRIQYLYS